jgi:hypothetical protein
MPRILIWDVGNVRINVGSEMSRPCTVKWQRGLWVINCKLCRRKWSWPNFIFFPGTWLHGLNDITTNVHVANTRTLYVPPECQFWMSITQPRRVSSVKCAQILLKRIHDYRYMEYFSVVHDVSTTLVVVVCRIIWNSPKMNLFEEDHEEFLS